MELSKDILDRIPDLPKVMDNANKTLQMIAEEIGSECFEYKEFSG